MNAEIIIQNIKTSTDYINALKNHLSDIIWDAIDKADAEYKETDPDYLGSFKRNIGECCRAPFGHKISPEDLYRKIKCESKSSEPFVNFREDVYTGPSHYYKIPTEYVQMIAKHLGIEG